MKLQIRVLLALFACVVIVAEVFADSGSPKDIAAAELYQADVAFSKTAGVENKDAFFGTFLSDADLLAPHQRIAEGAETVGAVFQGMFDLPGFGLTWQPNKAEVAVDMFNTNLPM